ncbi:MAG: glycosyltransferase family 39 protein [candidate division WOR-3 bacterium]
MGTMISNHGPATSWQLAEALAARFGWLIIILVTLLGLGLRASDLRADPPWDISWSFAPFTDESLNTYSARNMVLYGAWKVDDFNPYVVYPLVNMLVAVVFKLLGVGLVQVKLVSVAAGTLSVLLLYLLVRKGSGSLAGLLAGLGLATCFPLVMYSRLGLIESVQILFLTCTGLFWVWGLSRPRLMFWSGLFAAGTVLFVKISALFLAPVMSAMLVWEYVDARQDQTRLRPLLRESLPWFTAGVVVVAAAWLLLVFIPFRHDYFQYLARHSFESPAGHPKTIQSYLFNTFVTGMWSRLFERMTWTALPGFVVLPFLLSGRHPVWRYLFLWFLFAMLQLGYMNYRPPRYETVIIPVIVASFAAILARHVTTGTILPRLKTTVPGALLYSLWLWPLTTQLILYIVDVQKFPNDAQALRWIGIGLVPALLLSFAGYLLIKLLRREVRIPFTIGRVALTLLMLGLSLQLDMRQFSNWFRSRSHNMYEWARTTDQVLPDSAVVIGTWAPPFMIESRKRAVAISDWANIDDPVRRFRATHIFLGQSHTDEVLAERLAEVIDRSIPMGLVAIPCQTWTQEIAFLALPALPATEPDSLPAAPAP